MLLLPLHTLIVQTKCMCGVCMVCAGFHLGEGGGGDGSRYPLQLICHSLTSLELLEIVREPSLAVRPRHPLFSKTHPLSQCVNGTLVCVHACVHVCMCACVRTSHSLVSLEL